MRSVAAAIVALALLAGPSLGACGDCCPAAPVPLSVSAAPSCCGDCETTVGRSPDPVSLAEASPSPILAAAAPLFFVVPAPPPPASAALFIAPASGASAPLPPPRPLRL